MTRDAVVAVLGISGVGKSRMIASFVDQHENFRHVPAGALLRAALLSASEPTGEKLRTTDSESIVQNQFILAHAFAADRAAHPGKIIIFDGHSVIDNDRMLVAVPVEVFAQIDPCAIIFVESEPKRIAAQRAEDQNRVRPTRSQNSSTNKRKLCESHRNIHARYLFR